MLFNSLRFLVFFPVVTAVYFALPHAWRWAWMLAMSCVFYAAFVPAYLLILATSIAIDYVAGIVIEDASPRWRKPALILSLVANIALLAIFKYGPFVWDNLRAVATLLGQEWADLGRLMLPIGLSFHTFQAMAYTIEVYYGRQRAERHLGIYALYVMFYPQQVAGPIERPQALLPQFRTPHPFDYDQVRMGLLRMLWGFIKKTVVADRLAVAADAVFNAPESQSGLAAPVGVICFAWQIYCDFSGYSDIALGAAQVMGYRLMENFDRPYAAASLAEFWHRWHRSLSQWFRDYLYFPLGGNRVGPLRHAFNLMIVFAISGLWHGAAWTYVLWGLYHGALLVLCGWLGTIVRVPRWLGRPMTVLAVCIGWILFRATSFENALAVGSACVDGITQFITTPTSARAFPSPGLPLGEIAWTIIGLEVAESMADRWSITPARIIAAPWYVRWIVYYAGIWLALGCGRFDARQFIYFQF